MKRFHLKPGMSLFACAACALGLLLWARLLLVSSPPRVATAEPAPVLQPKLAPNAVPGDAGNLTEEEQRLIELKIKLKNGW